jgi:hypothetical protein
MMNMVQLTGGITAVLSKQCIKCLLNVCQVDSPSGLFITAKILSVLVARGTEVGNVLVSDIILLMRALVFVGGPMVSHGKWGMFLNLSHWNILEKFAQVKGKPKCIC